MKATHILQPEQVRGLALCDKHLARYGLVFFGKGRDCPACLAESLERKIERTKQTIRAALVKINEMHAREFKGLCERI